MAPSRAQAEAYLREGQRLNPGPWVEHAMNAAEAAGRIADRHPELDADIAYALGCLHDIGRREGVSHLRHTIDGYRFLTSEGFEDAARICLTHSFPTKDVYSYFGEKDCTDADLAFIVDYLEKAEYTLYDRLIQLCDHLALPAGFCLIEKRMVDVVLRYGPNGNMVEKWRSVFGIQREIESAIGTSIYRLLPGVIENTFGF